MGFLYFLEGLRNPVLDAFFSLITHLGEETAFMVIALIFFWCVDKYKGYFLLFTGFCGTVFNQFLKMLCRIDRPWVLDPEFTIVESARAEATGYSFPSGHTQSAVGVFGGIARFSKRWTVRIIGIAICLLVALSRMYLGVHTPKDVLVSLLIGTVLVLLLYPFIEKSRNDPKIMYIIISITFALTLGNLLYVKLASFPSDVDSANLASAIENAWKMIGAVAGIGIMYPVERKCVRFETRAVWWAQMIKVAGGLALVVAVKSLLKSPLNSLLGAELGGGVRYLLMVVVAGILWPMIFKFFPKGKKTMKTYEFKETLSVLGEYDVIVAGGGVAGVAAAVSAKRMGKSVLLIEKTITLGGLATIGLINFFVPMCNGRGVQIIKGMAQEFLDLSIKYGFDTIPSDWKDRNPPKDTNQRYVTKYSAPIFTIALTQLIQDEGVDILFDTVVSSSIMEDGICRGLVVENKTGRSVYLCKTVVDASGDADVLYRSGVPTVQGNNYHTFYAHGATLDSCQKALEYRDMAKLEHTYGAAGANLYGQGHPEGKPYWKGTTAEDITQYVLECHSALLNNIKNGDRKARDISHLPTMPQFRTTRRIDGDYTLKESDAYLHFEDSIGAICDFERRDYLYEIPYRTMVKTGFGNIITAGRCVSGEGYGWDLLRVIPPAIITGQAAGIACSMAIDSSKPIYDIDINALQETLASQDVMIHFDDSLINTDGGEKLDIGHI